MWQSIVVGELPQFNGSPTEVQVIETEEGSRVVAISQGKGSPNEEEVYCDLNRIDDLIALLQEARDQHGYAA